MTMKETMKRLLTLTVAMAMLFSMFSVGVSAQAVETEPTIAQPTEPAQVETQPVKAFDEALKRVPEATETLELDVWTDAVITTGGDWVCFAFTPAQSGTYIFESNFPGDTYADLYDANDNNLTSDDDAGPDMNFLISYALTAGETYYLYVQYLNSELTGAIPVRVSMNPLVSLEFAPISVMEGTCGNKYFAYNQQTDKYDLQYWYYETGYLMEKLAYTATFSDGTVLSGNGAGFEYQGAYYPFNGYTNNQGYENQWLPGNTYEMVVSVMGVPVTIEETPLVSLSFTPTSVMENSNGWLSGGENENGEYIEYWHYHVWDLFSKSTYTAVFRDGTILTGNNSVLEYQGVTYSFAVSDNQSSQNQWTVGNTYALTVSLMGVDAKLPVAIEKTPLVSLEFTPVTVMEGTCGHTNTTYDMMTGEYIEYWWYYYGDLLRRSTYTATFKDGTVLTGSGDGFDYQGTWYSFNYTSDQDYKNPWLGGNTYAIDVSVMGVETQVPVIIEETPLVSLEFTPVTVMEGTCGYTSTGYDEQIGAYSYWYYQGWDLLNRSTYTATFRDGTVLTGSGYGFNYQDNYYSFTYSEDQNYNNQWVAGNTYALEVSVMGAKVKMPVTIRQTPLVSLSFTPVAVTEGTCGYLSTGYNEMIGEYAYWYYQPWNLLNQSTYTATFDDGTVLTGSGSGFNYQGVYYSFSTSDNQSFENQWTVGNTYMLQVSVMGSTVEVPVTIERSPVVSLTASPIVLEEHKGGYWTSHWQGDQRIEYFYYHWRERVSYTVTMSDGAVVTGNANGFTHNGVYYSVDCSAEQGGNNTWLARNSYPIPISVMGQTAETTVTIATAQTADGFTYIVQGDKAVITGCTLTNAVLQIPETIAGHTVVGITSLGEALRYATEIRIPDSVTMLSEDTFSSDGEYRVSLKKLYVGSGVSTLSVNVLREARNLEEVVVSAKNPYYCSIDGVVYNKDCSAMVFYPFAKQSLHIIPDSVTDIEIFIENIDRYNRVKVQFGAGITDYQLENGVLYNGDKTTILSCSPELTGSYVMPESVVESGWYSFANSNLTEITISPNVTEIVYAAFIDNSKLETIHIPASVTSIGSYAFEGCDALKAVCIEDLDAWCTIFFADNPLEIARDLYLNGELVTDLVLPSVTHAVYSGAFCNGSMTSLTVPSNVKFIDYGAFYGSAIQTVNFSEGLESIEADAFACSAVRRVDLPDSLVWLGESAFRGCGQLEELTIGDGLTELSWNVFEGTALTSVVIPENVRYIQGNAFRNSKLTDVQFDCKEVYIGESAFENCPLGDLIFGDNVKMIYDEAFKGNRATQVILPESVTEITYRAFAFGYNLVSVTIPDSITSIHPGAFTGDFNLSHVLYTGTEQQWNKIGCESAELNQAVIHYNAVGNEVTTEQTDTHIYYYCSICKQREAIAKLTGIRITKLPSKLEYVRGQKLHTAGMVVMGTYADGSRTEITDYTIDVELFWQTGKRDVTVSYGGFQASFAVTVRGGAACYSDGDYGIEVVVPDGAFDEYVGVRTTTVDIQEILPDIPDVLAENPSVIYDVYMHNGSVAVQPQEPVTVAIPVPETMKGYACKVYHVAEDGTLTDMQACFEAGYMVFTVSHFSYFAVVEEPTVLGDITEDGSVNNDDVVLLLWHTLFPEDYPIAVSGDLNVDGSINNDDVVLLLWHTLFPEDYPLGA